MIIVTRANITEAELDHIRERIEAAGLKTHLSRGERRTIVGCIGDEALRVARAQQVAHHVRGCSHNRKRRRGRIVRR